MTFSLTEKQNCQLSAVRGLCLSLQLTVDSYDLSAKERCTLASEWKHVWLKNRKRRFLCTKTLFSILYINALVLLTRNRDFVNRFLRITDASFLVDRRKGLIFAFVNEE